MSTNLATKKSKKQNQMSTVINYLFANLQGTVVKDEDEVFLNTISIAKQEMLDAQCYFDSVTAPELIDHAIYRMEAAKAQYVYLLKLAKDRELKVRI